MILDFVLDIKTYKKFKVGKKFIKDSIIECLNNESLFVRVCFLKVIDYIFDEKLVTR